MSRVKNPKNTCPENSGAQNMIPSKMPVSEAKKLTKTDELNKKSLKKVQCMLKHRITYKGSWDEESFQKAVDDYFEWCFENVFEPSMPSLCLWLGCTKEVMAMWRTDPKCGFKHDIIHKAQLYMETIYLAKTDDSPIASFFKLKTNGFGYVEQNKVEVVSSNPAVTAEDLNATLEKLGVRKTSK